MDVSYILKIVVLLLVSISNNCVHCESDDPILRIFTGKILDKDRLPEIPTPYGENEGDFTRDKSLDCTCGLSHRIFKDGNSTLLKSISALGAPWLVFIYVMFDSTGRFTPNKICSGTIINDRVVLTSASCLVNVPTTEEEILKFVSEEWKEPDPETVVVLLAKSEEINLKDNNTFTRLEAKYVTFNPYFFYSYFLYDKHDWDIAFIELKQPLTFDDSTGFVPICLPPKYLVDGNLEGVPMVSVGWAKFSEDDLAGPQTKPTMYSLKLHRTSHVHRKRFCQVVTIRHWLSDRYFCTNGPRFLDTKFIESNGSPMLYQTLTEPFSLIQYGMVSWDLIGMLVRKKNARISINVSGFLEVIEDFSDSREAKWCSRDAPSSTKPIPHFDWNGGKGLLQPLSLSMIQSSEWNGVNSGHRQYFPFSVCQCDKTPVVTQPANQQQVFNWNVWLVQDTGTACAGTIINDMTVLTTASCLHRMSDMYYEKGLFGSGVEIIHRPKNLKVDLSFTGLMSKPSQMNVAMIIPHVEYLKSEYHASDNDIALVVVEKAFSFSKLDNSQLTPVCLPEYDFDLNSVQGSFLLPNSNNNLGPVGVEILDKSLCISAWRKDAEELKKPLGMVPRNVEELFEFSTRFCGVVEEADFNAYVKEAHGIPVVAVTNTILTQIGILSSLTNTILKPKHCQDLATNQDFSGIPLSNKVIIAFNEIRPLLSFIEYFSLVLNAKWCPASRLVPSIQARNMLTQNNILIDMAVQ